MMSNEHREVIEKVRRLREEEARFFSNRPEMERWVVQKFLTTLGLSFQPEELMSQTQADSVDVVFRQARFQVKEIYDPTRRRDAEIRESLVLAKAAVTTEDLYGAVTVGPIVLADLATLLLDKASSIKYPPRERASLDLLCYVTRPRAGFDEPPELVGERFRPLGWRSISCLLGNTAYRLTSSPTSPEFLRQP